MAKIELRKVIRCPKEKAVEYFGDPHAYYGVHESETVSFRILRSDNSGVVVESEQEIAGRRVKFTTRIVYHLPNKIESETLTPLGMTSKQTTTLKEVAEGTEVTYRTDLRGNRKWAGMLARLGRKSIMKTFDDEAEKDRRHLEGSERDE